MPPTVYTSGELKPRVTVGSSVSPRLIILLGPITEWGSSPIQTKPPSGFRSNYQNTKRNLKLLLDNISVSHQPSSAAGWKSRVFSLLWRNSDIVIREQHWCSDPHAHLDILCEWGGWCFEIWVIASCNMVRNGVIVGLLFPSALFWTMTHHHSDLTHLTHSKWKALHYTTLHTTEIQYFIPPSLKQMKGITGCRSCLSDMFSLIPSPHVVPAGLFLKTTSRSLGWTPCCSWMCASEITNHTTEGKQHKRKTLGLKHATLSERS